MVIHARSGVRYKIVGMMQGNYRHDHGYSFALPVQGNETRGNAGSEEAEYIVQYFTGSERVLENAIV
ncbi:hypothetical protein E1B28_007793 [Marasmius oreades]|uniref:Uncharacterized protein n=1 Tax=Marasmius oreades TaxID=181124 RepID=A0A9P7UVB8_9AGAR|nr:uncharacterized protein E1B28_007793 [Marasmius oreades]KAG7094186.1 hypothetical protein E1B28_007793 [Marasmius oreades]